MSAAAAVSRAAAPARHIARPTRQPPRIKKPLRKDVDTGLPRPPVKVLIRDTHLCRLQEHYYNTLQDDLMYITYKHHSGPPKIQRQIRLRFDPADPYSKKRPIVTVGGSHVGRKPAQDVTPETIVRLERIQLHMMAKDAITSKQNLLGPIMAFRAISGETEKRGGHHTAEGVQIVTSIKSVGGWGRAGQAIGVKVDLRGPRMYEFLGTLVEFVLPRLREFNGIPLPAEAASLISPSAVSGVVSLGLAPEAFGLFPQLEVNLDAYPKSYGFHVHFITNAEGQGAQDRARALLSGFQVPFARRG